MERVLRGEWIADSGAAPVTGALVSPLLAFTRDTSLVQSTDLMGESMPFARSIRRIPSTLVILCTVGIALPAEAQQENVQPLSLTTTAFANGGVIPVRFSQAADGALPGEGTSPELRWENVPPDTRSFVLHMYDLDVARMGTTETQLHWLVWDLPGTATGLPEGLPRGSRLSGGGFQTSATGPVYRGPGAAAIRPPHHYVFELYALDTVLDVQPLEDPFESRELVFKAMQGHVLGKAVYFGMFRRPE